VAAGVPNDVWHKLVFSKVSMFAWRLLQDRIPTRSNLVRRHVLQPTNNVCVGGCGSSETVDHLFIGCDVFGRVWYSVCHWIGISCVFSGSVTDHYSQFIQLACLPRLSHYYLKVIWLACILRLLSPNTLGYVYKLYLLCIKYLSIYTNVKFNY